MNVCNCLDGYLGLMLVDCFRFWVLGIVYGVYVSVAWFLVWLLW